MMPGGRSVLLPLALAPILLAWPWRCAPARADEPRPPVPAQALAPVPSAPPSHAGPGPCPAAVQQESARELAGHMFLPSELVPNPFITTHFGSLTGFTFALAQGTDPQGNQVSKYLGGFSPTFQFQYAPLPVWAVYVYGSGQLLGNVDLNNIDQNGVLFGYNVGGGTTVSGKVHPRVRLGGSLGVEYNPTYSITVGSVFNSLVPQLLNSLFNGLFGGSAGNSGGSAGSSGGSAGNSGAPSFLTTAADLKLSYAVQAAVAAHRALGFYTDLRFTNLFTDSSGMKISGDTFTLGAAVSFDARAISRAAIGLLGAYRLVAPITPSPALRHQVGVGLYYTGRRDLALGLDAIFEIFPNTAGISAFAVAPTIVMRYYF